MHQPYGISMGARWTYQGKEVRGAVPFFQHLAPKVAGVGCKEGTEEREMRSKHDNSLIMTQCVSKRNQSDDNDAMIFALIAVRKS